jgi:hypothetical protein
MAYEPKKIDRDQVVNYLNHAFAKAIQPLGNKNTKGTDLYNHQVDFSYLIDSIQRSPTYIVSKVITDCNRLIDMIVEQSRK